MRKYLQFTVLALLVALSSQAYSDFDQKQFNEMFAKYIGSKEGQDAIGSAVEKYFKERQEQVQKEREQQQLAELEKQFKAPVKVPAGNSPVKGPKDAPITIIEFSDFQCPYCSRANTTVEQILEAYPKEVKVVFKNLPLGFHKEADPAARAALAANKQGKFWEFHDKLFENQAKLSSSLYKEIAKDLKLDLTKFEEDMNSKEIKDQVKADTELAREVGISGTPGFFVNGVAVKGAYPLPHFKMIIDRWLKQG